VMPLFHTVQEQLIYCQAFHANTLRALNNLATVLADCNDLSTLLVSNMFLADQPPNKRYKEEKMRFPALYTANMELKAARFRALHTLLRSVKTLAISSDSDGMDDIAIPGHEDDPDTDDPYNFAKDPAAGSVYNAYHSSAPAVVARQFFESIEEAQCVQELRLSPLVLATLRSEFYREEMMDNLISGPDGYEEEVQELREELRELLEEPSRLNALLDAAKAKAARQQSVATGMDVMDDDIAVLERRLERARTAVSQKRTFLEGSIEEAQLEFEIENRLFNFANNPSEHALNVSDSDCLQYVSAIDGGSLGGNLREILATLTGLRRIVVEEGGEYDMLDLDAVLKLPPQISSVVVECPSFPDPIILFNHTKPPNSTILRYFPRLAPQPEREESTFELVIKSSAFVGTFTSSGVGVTRRRV